jgi:hypothetical protein
MFDDFITGKAMEVKDLSNKNPNNLVFTGNYKRMSQNLSGENQGMLLKQKIQNIKKIK